MIELGRRRLRARAVSVEGSQREELWPVLALQMPVIDLYRARARRQIPVVRLDVESL
jgi:hypothetical protein